MRQYHLLPHTADVRLSVSADSLSELFKGSLEGMSEMLKRGATRSRPDPATGVRIQLSAPDTTTLLIDFLNEALAHDAIERVVLYDVSELILDDTRLNAVIQGVRADGFDEDIKAATYHEAHIEQRAPDAYYVRIVLDV